VYVHLILRSTVFIYT